MEAVWVASDTTTPGVVSRTQSADPALSAARDTLNSDYSSGFNLYGDAAGAVTGMLDGAAPSSTTIAEEAPHGGKRHGGASSASRAAGGGGGAATYNSDDFRIKWVVML
jgi:hypothetical protein